MTKRDKKSSKDDLVDGIAFLIIIGVVVCTASYFLLNV